MSRILDSAIHFLFMSQIYGELPAVGIRKIAVQNAPNIDFIENFSFHLNKSLREKQLQSFYVDVDDNISLRNHAAPIKPAFWTKILQNKNSKNPQPEISLTKNRNSSYMRKQEKKVLPGTHFHKNVCYCN
ncbi:hypothetical protein WUBG_04189 [Wuchereria bancrofti]|uniref:Uncharacterized protein n=1 Tax=Wuchereria bancrofti TaxID=6293 RepID=J9EQT2_WUCBA|nr:hypothetical protein WUBG_04189 [Wuchereria bancrofti]VDM07253.1 unnamed protein product [Wuchereria bancrofti]